MREREREEQEKTCFASVVVFRVFVCLKKKGERKRRKAGGGEKEKKKNIKRQFLCFAEKVQTTSERNLLNLLKGANFPFVSNTNTFLQTAQCNSISPSPS